MQTNSLQNSRSNLTLLIGKEFSAIKKSKSFLTLFIVYPIAIGFLLMYMFNAGLVINLPVAVVDQDSSKISRTIIQRISATPEVLITQRYNDLTSAKQALQSGEVFGVIFIPPSFEQHSLAGNQPEVTTFYNNQYMTIGGALNRSVSATLRATVAEIQLNRLMEHGITRRVAQGSLQAIPTDLHPLFNPSLNYLFSLANGLFPNIMQIVMMMTMAGSILRDILERDKLKQSLRLAKKNIFTYLLTKIFLYFCYFTLTIFLFDFVLTHYFDSPFNGSLILYMLGTSLYVFAALLYGTLIAVATANKVRTYSLVSIFTSPAFGFTGLIFPRLAMNSFAFVWSSILPITWYMQIKLDQTLRGTDFIASLKPFYYLLIQITVVFTLIYLVFRRSQKSKI